MGAAALLLFVASTVAAEATAPRPPLGPLPPAAFEEVDPQVAEQLDEVRAHLEGLLATTEASNEELAAAYGLLGRLYMVYLRLEAAEAAFANAILLAPEDWRWPYYLGTIYQELRRVDEAAVVLGAALELRPDDPPTLVRLGRVELERGDVAAAEARFASVLASGAATAAARFGLGSVAFERGEFERAAGLFEEVLAAQPQASRVHHQLGLCFREIGDLDRARHHLRLNGPGEVEFRDPLIDSLGGLSAGYGVRIARGSQARMRGDFEGAVRAFRLALEADPESVTARQALATTYLQMGDRAAAFSELSALLESDPENATAHYHSANILLARGEVEAAVSHLSRAVAIAPDYADARFNLAQALEASGDEAAAEVQYDAVLALRPGDIDARVARALLIAREGGDEEAEVELEAVLEIDPESAAALMGLGALFERSGRQTAAQEVYLRVLTIEARPRQAGVARLRLGLFALQQGASEEAVEHLSAAVELLPASRPAFLALATALGRGGRFRDAADAYEAAVRLEPDDPEARFGQALALLLAEEYGRAETALRESLVALPDAVALRHALARLLATCPDPDVRDGEEALTLAREVFEAQQRLDHAETVAMALAESGSFAEAITWQRRIITEAERAGLDDRRSSLESRLASYEAGAPIRAPWLR